jgi:hypothetical protein
LQLVQLAMDRLLSSVTAPPPGAGWLAPSFDDKRCPRLQTSS